MAQYTHVLRNIGPSAKLVTADGTKTVNIANKAFGGYNRWIVMVQLEDMPDMTNKRIVSMKLNAHFSDNSTGGAHTTYMGLITAAFNSSTPYATLYNACTGAPAALAKSTNSSGDFVDVEGCDKVPISSNLPTSFTSITLDLTGTEIASMLEANPAAYKGFWMGLGYRGQNSVNIMVNNEYTLSLTLVLEDAFSACTPPSAASLSAALSEGNVDLSYSGAAGGTNNAMTGLEVQYAESDDNANWSAWAAYTVASTSNGSGTISVAPSSTRARYRKFQVRVRGAAGADYYSGWKAVTGSVRKNSAPAAPGVTAPVASKIIYNSQPRILATVGSDADGHSQTLAASGYAASNAGAQAPGKKLLFRLSSAASAGAQSISVSSTDALGAASGATARSFTYVVPAWTDASLVAGTTPIKAVHIAELQAAINNVRAYYGMAAYPFIAITAGVTGLAGWTTHIGQLRAAIDEVVSLVNGWDTANGTNDISLPAWIAISVNCPSVAVIAQLRAAIPLL